MTSITTESESLEQLQTPEQVKLLDTIDQLRHHDLEHHDISLPQLIVCGEQSSGKSSVLEGLTRLRFPTKDGRCTTFATELILRKQARIDIQCTINPAKSRSEAERKRLRNFKKSFTSREEFAFPSLLEEAREKMAHGTSSTPGPFFKDVMKIKYSGPDLPSLTIVDLPGIIQSQVEGEDGVKLVRDLVEHYMKDSKSIILAVVSARNDLENQSVLNFVKTYDPSGTRTLGIITKPDTLNVGSTSEARFVKLASNKVMPLKLGWHVVKNRDNGQRGQSGQSDEERDESERQFFEMGVWNSLPRENVAIDALRVKLSRVLLQHIRNELPSLTTAIRNAISSAENDLKGLGSPRHEPQQQRSFLMEKAQKFQILTLDALRGLYNENFFAVTSSDAIPPTRLRSQIQDLNLAFADAMYSRGHKYDIVGDQAFPDQGAMAPNTTHSYDCLPIPIRVDMNEFLNQHIGQEVRTSRPSGLTSLVNPWVIGAVFRQQAKPWKDIASQHLREVYEAVQSYLEKSLTSMMDEDTFHALMHEHVGPELERRRAQLDKKLDELLIPYEKLEPIIYDPSFITELRQIRDNRQFPKPQFSFSAPPKSSISGTQLLTQSLDDFTNLEILNLMQVYYKKAISVFISNVTVLAIENCLVTNLPSLLSPDLVLNMDEQKLHIIAAESDKTSNERLALKQTLADLKEGQRILEEQARKSGKGAREVPRWQRVAAPTPVSQSPFYRPSTPADHIASSDPAISVDNLASSFNNIRVTPPRITKAPLNPLFGRSPATPPKSPKAATKPRKTFSDAEDSSDEL